MSISNRNKILVSKNVPLTNYVLVEFSDFLNEPWGRLSPNGDLQVVDGGTVHTYYDYFIDSSFPTIRRSLDFFSGGLKPVSNISFKLSNTDNLIKTIGTNVLEYTEVRIYILIDVGNTPDKTNAELRFVGKVDGSGVNWNDEEIEITIIDILENNDKDILNTKLTKKDYPNITDAEDQYLPIIGGGWNDNANQDWPTYVREKGLDACTPTYNIDPKTNTFMFADHPVKTLAADIIPTNTFDEQADVRRPIGRSFVYSDGASSLYTLYNGTTDVDTDGYVNSFTIPENTKVMQGFLKPVGTQETQAVTNPNNITDSNLIIETGRDCKTNFIIGPNWETGYIYLNFPSIEINYNPVSTNGYLEIVGAESQLSSCEGNWLICTDGFDFTKYTNQSDGTAWFIKERSVPTKYLIRRYDAPNYGYQQTDFIWDLDNTNRLIRSTNILKEWIGDQPGQEQSLSIVSRITRRIASDGSWSTWASPKIMPPINIEAMVKNSFLAGDDSIIVYRININNLSWQSALIDNDRLKKWRLGIQARRCKLESIYIHVNDLYYKGGIFNNFPKYPKLKSENFKVKVLGITVYTSNKKDNKQKLEKYQREIDKYYDRIDEVKNLSNVHPVFVMLDGYTTNNTPSGTAIRSPGYHIRYILEHRMGINLSSETDNSSFSTVISQRSSNDGDAFKNKWENHVCISSQKTTHNVLRQFADENNLIIYSWNNKYYIQDRDLFDNYTGRWATSAVFDETEILSYDFSKQDSVYDSFELNYAFSYAKGDYLRTLKFSPTENNWYTENDSVFDNIDPGNYDITGYSKTALQNILIGVHDNYFNKDSDDDLNKLTVNLDFIQSVDTARRLMIGLIKLYGVQRSIVKFKCGKKGLILKLGDVMYCSHKNWRTADCGNYLVTSIIENPNTLEFEIKGLKVE